MQQNIVTSAVNKHTANTMLIASGGTFSTPAYSVPDYFGSTAASVTMSSLEIAELTGKRHDNVMADIRTMLDGLEMPALSFQGCYTGGNGKDLPLFNLPRDLTETLITGYNIPLRHKVVVRLRELEDQVAKPQALALPDFTNAAVAARAWATEFEGRVLALEVVKAHEQKIAEDAPKVQVFNKLIDSEGLLGFQEFCTKHNLNQRTIKLWLRDIKWLRANRWERNPLPTSKAVDAGYCEIKTENSEFGFSQTLMFTAKAEAYIELKAPDYVRKPVRKSKGKKAA